MIPQEVADVANVMAEEFGGELDDYIAVAYRIVNALKKAGGGS